MQALIIFIITFFSILFIAGILILTFLYGKRTTRNNPKNAIVLVKNGLEILSYKGKMKGKPAKTGVKYEYNNTFVLVPASSKEYYYKNKRLLIVNQLGQLIATPFGNDIYLTNSERENLIYELVESSIGSEIIHSMRGKSTVSIIIVAIIAFIIGAGAVLGYNAISKMMANQQVLTQPTTTNTTQNLPPIGVTK